MAISQGIAIAQSSYANVASQNPKSVTISSAAEDLDRLNGRLLDVVKSLSGISSNLGGPSPEKTGGGSDSLPTTGAVYRLRDGVNEAHIRLTHIEGLIEEISRAVG